MADIYLAGVATVDLFDGQELFSTAKTLVDSSVSLNVSLEEIRAGQGAKLYGKYAHSSVMDITLTDAMFRLEYIAKNVGGEISIGGTATFNEQVTVTKAGSIEVTNTPAAFGAYGTVGWYKKPTDSAWTSGVFNGKTLTIAGATVGEIYCVKYVNTYDSMRQLVVNANFIPATVHAVMTASLFQGNSNNPNDANTTKIGEVQIDIPRLMLSGAQDITMNMTGAAQTPLTGSALASSSTESCEDDAIYGTIKEIINGSNWIDDAYALAITPPDLELAVGEKETIGAYALIRNASPKKVSPTQLTFTSAATATATVSNTGEVSGVVAGKTTINVTLTAKPAVEGFANVTVV